MPSTNGKWTNPNLAHIDHETGQALQSLSSYLGGWREWDGTADLSWSAGGYTKGNAVVTSSYRLTGDECHFYGTYTSGSTTAWPAGAAMRLVLPYNCIYPANMEETGVTAFIASGAGAGRYHGLVVFGGPTVNFVSFIDNKHPSGGFYAQNYPAFVGAGDAVVWNFRYRVVG